MMEEANKKNLEYWNHYYTNNNTIMLENKSWLNKFSSIIDSSTRSVIDLGCGNGNNIPYLLGKGKNVIPCDGSKQAINNINKRFPTLDSAICFDMLDKFPFNNNIADLIIADLCLHYFTREDTIKILKEIKRILINKGNLLLRVNSINDSNYGALNGKEIEPHLYMSDDGRYKRFFDQKDIYEIFNIFDIKYVREDITHKYKLEKKLFEVHLKNRK